MDTALFNKLYGEGLIGDAAIEKIRAHQDQTDISVQWELKTILYIGVQWSGRYYFQTIKVFIKSLKSQFKQDC